MPEHLSEAVVQSFVAALVAEALVRLWRVQRAHQRLAFRLAALVAPLVLLPAFELLAPFRHEDWFTDRVALFSTRHLAALSAFGLRLDRAWPWPVFALGLLLFARDLGPLFSRRLGRAPHATDTGLERVAPVLARLSAHAGVEPPQPVLVRVDWPVLATIGVRRPRVLVSPALLASLDELELEAALAHELSHVRHRDVLWSWAVLGARALLAFNPVSQVVARLVAFETEVRADADGAGWTGRPATLASALLKVSGVPHRAPATGEVWLGERLTQARAFALEERCRRLLAPTPVVADAPGPGLVAFAAAGTSTLLFFVT